MELLEGLWTGGSVEGADAERPFWIRQERATQRLGPVPSRLTSVTVFAIFLNQIIMSETAALADRRVELLRPQPDSLPAGVIPRQPQTHPRSESLFRETTELKTRQSEKQTRTRSLESSGSDLESCQAQLDALQLEATQSVKEARQRPEIRLAENTGEFIASFISLIAGPASRVQPIVLGTQSEQLM